MARAPNIVAQDQIAAACRDVGIAKGDTVIVHASLSRLGYVVGGAESMVRALLGCVGAEGTLMAPTQTWLNLDPSRNVHGLDRKTWPALRRALPGFDPTTTPSVGMGAVAEMVRVWPGARRSTHPARSWSAVGSRAGDLVAEHDLNDVHGEASPLGAAWKADARVLLAGVGYDKCTALHLAETRAKLCHKRYEEDRSWLRADGMRQEVRYRSLAFDDGDFACIGTAFEAAAQVQLTQLGDGEVRAFGLRDLVDFATHWMERNR